jgi:hypothetical protein
VSAPTGDQEPAGLFDLRRCWFHRVCGRWLNSTLHGDETVCHVCRAEFGVYLQPAR